MGDDPAIPAELMHTEARSGPGGSAASGGSVVNVYQFSKSQMVLLVVVVGLALGLAIGAVVMMAWGQAIQRDHSAQMQQASEARTMDRAAMAEREARIAMDEVQRMKLLLERHDIRTETH